MLNFSIVFSHDVFIFIWVNIKSAEVIIRAPCNKGKYSFLTAKGLYIFHGKYVCKEELIHDQNDHLGRLRIH